MGRLGHAITGTAMVVAFLTFGGSTAGARSPDEPGVARISALRGDVDIKRADSSDVVAAAVNAPLSTDDLLTTHDGARAEVQFDARSALRVAANTQMRFTRLEAGSSVAQLAEGTVEMRSFRSAPGRFEIDTPSATIVPQSAGRYRVTVDGDGNARVTVRSGDAKVAVVDGPFHDYESGTTVSIQGSGASARTSEGAEIARDSFDDWNAERDRFERDVPSYAYADDRYIGSGDLDRYGTWQEVADYGNVWRPAYAADWAPYHDGRWAWEPYYGWTWIGAEPWGWTPYHYGRWFYANDLGWCWYPGAQFGTPVYRPALVTFLGFGNIGAGFGFGNVAWIPLAPFEPYRPWWGPGYDTAYGTNRTVVNNLTNVTNVTNITNITNVTQPGYASLGNAHAPGAIVALTRDRFAAGRFAHPTTVSLERLRAERATVTAVVPVEPTHANLVYSSARPPAHATSMLFDRMTHRAGSGGERTTRSFDAQRALVRATSLRLYARRLRTVEPSAQKHAETPISVRGRDVVPRSSAARRPVRIDDGNATAATNDPWSRFTKREAHDIPVMRGDVDSLHDVRNVRASQPLPHNDRVAGRGAAGPNDAPIRVREDEPLERHVGKAPPVKTRNAAPAIEPEIRLDTRLLDTRAIEPRTGDAREIPSRQNAWHPAGAPIGR